MSTTGFLDSFTFLSILIIKYKHRGNRQIYDNWAQVYGATGWDYASVLPFFIRYENNTAADIVARNPGYHGTSGPVRVSRQPYVAPLLSRLHEQMNVMGIPTRDFNGPIQLGTDISQLTTDGVRTAAGTSYIDPNPFPQYLHISARTFVRRVIFEGKTAVGVEYERPDGSVHTVRAEREVILSAGTINSAQLLMLSGINKERMIV